MAGSSSLTSLPVDDMQSGAGTSGASSSKVPADDFQSGHLEMVLSSSSTSAARTEKQSEIQPQHSINIIPPSPQESKANLPSPLYLQENQREEYQTRCLPLYEAALRGEWEKAETIFTSFPDLMKMSISKNYDTALHIASSTKHTDFVEKLVNLMVTRDINSFELQNKNWDTALTLSAAAGTIKTAQILLSRSPQLFKKRGNNNMLPVLVAAVHKHKDMVSYLYVKDENKDYWTAADRIMLLHYCVKANLYDIALNLLANHKTELTQETDKNALYVLAGNPLVFVARSQSPSRRLLNTMLCKKEINPEVLEVYQALQIVRIIWREIVGLETNEIGNIIRGPPAIIKVKESNDTDARYVDKFIGYRSRLLFVAAASGNSRFLIELLRLRPELIWEVDDDERTIFHVAVLHRQESVYNIIYEIGLMKDLVTTLKDTNGNSILHLAAMKPEKNRLHYVSGLALQMQREILWFKEVENVVHPFLREMRNNQEKTPQELFIEQHAELREKGEKWMKETASQCMVVAALIATIMFAAAFTLPGGNDQDSGHPIFKNRSAFMVFVITDAISLFSSSTSILVFLSILTARYEERDFLVSLPLKLMVGLLTLFISITTMMIAFSASFFLVYTKEMKWVPYLITGLAGGPVLLFARLHRTLFLDVVSKTYNSRFLFKPKKHTIY